MNEFLLSSVTNIANLSLETILLNNAVTIVIAAFIMITYKVTYKGAAYSKKFNVSLGMMIIITTFIMSVISNNIALSLGMVGALSIVRFRTAVKDVRDTTYIFWGIAVGISCGVSQYILAAITSVVVFIFLIVMGQTKPDGKVSVIVSCLPDIQNKENVAVDKYFQGEAIQKMKNSDRESCEIIYEIKRNIYEKVTEENQADIVQKLLTIDGVINVSQTHQAEDITR